jgi:hypothetical protein
LIVPCLSSKIMEQPSKRQRVDGPALPKSVVPSCTPRPSLPTSIGPSRPKGPSLPGPSLPEPASIGPTRPPPSQPSGPALPPNFQRLATGPALPPVAVGPARPPAEILTYYGKEVKSLVHEFPSLYRVLCLLQRMQPTIRCSPSPYRARV